MKLLLVIAYRMDSEMKNKENKMKRHSTNEPTDLMPNGYICAYFKSNMKL